MIRYSSYAATNFRIPTTQIIYLDRLEAEYRGLLELRERVKKAEAVAAQRMRSGSGNLQYRRRAKRRAR